MTQRLATSASATLDSSGRGVVAIGPVVPGLSWEVERLTTNGGSDPEPTLHIYRGRIQPTAVVDFTERGNGDVSEAAISLFPSETIIAEWTGGQTGVTMTLVVEGEVTPS